MNPSSFNQTAADMSLQKYLVFTLLHEHFALPLLKVKEVMAVPEFTTLPYMPAHYKGMINLRGQIISLLDLRIRFRLSRIENTAETTAIIVDLQPLCVGVIVDSVESVLDIGPQQISPCPQVETSIKSDYMLGVTHRSDRLIVLLDIAKALGLDQMTGVADAASLLNKAS